MNTGPNGPLEIERKFLLVADSWRSQVVGQPRRLSQGYLFSDPRKSVRVRLAGDSATLTVKGTRSGISRLEFQYPIPPADAARLLALCQGPLIDKTRHIVHHAGMKWEIDIFHGDNEGLRIAEIELEHEDQPIDLPEWVGEEVSHDPKFYNSELTRHPYCSWKK
jgi:adenylate cyclase